MMDQPLGDTELRTLLPYISAPFKNSSLSGAFLHWRKVCCLIIARISSSLSLNGSVVNSLANIISTCCGYMSEQDSTVDIGDVLSLLVVLAATQQVSMSSILILLINIYIILLVFFQWECCTKFIYWRVFQC